VNAVVEFDSLQFRIQALAPDGQIELVGMSILPPKAEASAGT
jgi:hypothetical protein